MPQEFTFASFLNDEIQKHTQESNAAETQTDNESVHTEGSAGDQVNEQAVPSNEAPVISLASLLEKKGVMVEGGDSEELYETVVSRALAGAQAQSELARLREELESLRAAAQQGSSTAQQTAATPASQESQSEQPAASQQQSRLFRELQKYDPLLETYVERDETGFARPVAAYGQVSIDAARQINDYERASREQADRLLRNPLAVVEDAKDIIARVAEERAQRIIDEKLAVMKREQEEFAQKRAAEEQIKSVQQQEYEWHEANKAKLFHLDAKGEPKMDVFGSGGFAMTSTGQRFLLELNTLRQQLPNSPELALRDLALKIATAAAPATAPAQAAAPETPAAPLTQAQQRKQLLADTRQTIPNQNQTPATPAQAVASSSRLRLIDMARQNPELAERMSGWR